MRRFLKTEIAAVIDRRETFVGALRIMNAVITAAARHQRRDHHARSDLQRLAHEVFDKFAAGFDDDAAEFMTKRKRPRQRFGPVPFEDVQVGAANAAGADLDQRRFLWNFRPGNAVDHRLGARTGKGRDADLLHASVLFAARG